MLNCEELSSYDSVLVKCSNALSNNDDKLYDFCKITQGICTDYNDSHEGISPHQYASTIIVIVDPSHIPTVNSHIETSSPIFTTTATTTQTLARLPSEECSPTNKLSTQISTVATLGTLVGLLILLLTVVTMGWVWTCLVMKKREGMNNTSTKAR